MRNRILVVDDERELVELLRFNLDQAGFVVSVATDGAEGLKAARSLCPDLILLDLMLPEIDGFEVCEILKRDRLTARIPIVMLTAMSGQLARAAGIGAGAAQYICKPFSLKLLLGQIKTILNRATGPDAFQLR